MALKLFFNYIKRLCCIIGMCCVFVMPAISVPSGYTALEYLESNGSQYINTGLTLAEGYKAEVYAYPVAVSGSYCALTGTNGNMQMAINSGGTPNVGNASGSGNYIGSWHKFVVTYSATKSLGTYFIDDVNTNLTRTSSSSAMASKQTLFCETTKSSGYMCAAGTKIKYAKWYNASGTVLRNLIPVRRDSDSVLGMYDTVTDAFFTNAGSGTFVAGPVASLPANYTKLEYIKSSGGQWINTGVIPTLDYTVEVKAIKQANTSLFGSETQGYTFTGSGTANYAYIGNTRVTLTCSDQTQAHIWKIATKTAYCDSNASSASTGTTQPTLPLALFARTTSATTVNDSGSHTMYYAKIYDASSKLVRNFVPAKRNSDSVVGMYDMINGVFYTNSGSGSFVAGPVVSLHIATTKYVETAFSPLITALNTAIKSVASVVSTTATQAGQIKTIAETKQNRPDDYNTSEQCPDGKKCLLIQDASGVPHWLEIYDPANDFLDTLSKVGIPTPSLQYFHGDSEWQQKYGDGTTNVKIEQVGTNGGMYRTLSDAEWAVEYKGIEADGMINGMIYGTSKCVNKNLTGTVSSGVKVTAAQLADPLFDATPADTNAPDAHQQCWCKMTDVGGLGLDGSAEKGNLYPIDGTSWVFFDTVGSGVTCAAGCAQYCADKAQNNSDFRSTLFDILNPKALIKNFLTLIQDASNPKPIEAQFHKSGDGENEEQLTKYHTLGGMYRALQNGEWAIVYTGNEFGTPGVIYGTTKCNAVGAGVGTIAPSEQVANDPSFEIDDGACWCGMTSLGLQADGFADNIYSVSGQSWVFAQPFGSYAECSEECATLCAGYTMDKSDFRAVVLGLGSL